MLFIKGIYLLLSHLPTSPASGGCLTPSSAIIIGLRNTPPSGETAEKRFHMLARGWLAYPVTPTHHPSTAEERLYNRHPIGLPRPVTPCAIRRERSLRFPEAPLFALINYCFLTA